MTNAITPPELPKFIVNRSGQHRYVFTYKNRWDKETKRSTRGKGDTQSVGKLIDVEGRPDCGEILFNEDFKAQYPELRLLRVFRYKGGRLEFKPLDEDLVNIVRPERIVRLHAGATWALKQIVGDSPLGRVLREVFPKHNAYLRLLSLAYYLVINKNATLSDYEEFAECTWLPYRKGTKGSSLSRLLQTITKDKVSQFLNKLNRQYRKRYGEGIAERRFWALDSTSITSYSENIASVEYGHNKDLIEAPQTNVLMIVDQQSGEPVYFRNFNGNVPDVSTVRNTLAELAMMKIDFSHGVLVTDRGYGSSANWEDMMRNGMSFVSNAKLNLNSIIKETLNEHYLDLLNWNNTIAFIKQNAVTVPIEWHYDEFPIAGKRSSKKAKKTLYLHLYHSKAINDEMTDRLQLNLCVALEQYKRDPKKLTDGQRRLIDRYVEEVDGQLRINMHQVNETLKYAGVRVLVSDAIKDAQECCLAYEERNQVEYAFNMLKARLECNRTMVHSTQAWDGKLFVQILAMAIAGMIRSRIKIYNETAKQNKKKYRVHYDSDHKLLAKLNNIYMTQFKAGWMFDEIVGKHRELFNILNVPVPTVEQVIADDSTDEDSDETDLSFDLENLPLDDEQEDL